MRISYCWIDDETIEFRFEGEQGRCTRQWDHDQHGWSAMDDAKLMVQAICSCFGIELEQDSE